MSTEPNEVIVHRYYEAASKTNLAAWDDLCDPDLVVYASGFPEPVRGLGAVKKFTAAIHSAFSGFRLTVDELIAENDRAAVRMTMGGTHTASLMTSGGSIPATGKQVAVPAISIVRLTRGKIVEERVVLDALGMLQQIGVIPSSLQGRSSPREGK